MNHLGLIAAIERLANHPLPILNCSKCSTFWLTLMHGIVCHCGLQSHRCVIMAFAVAFLMAYVAIWMELALGVIDKMYNYVYNKIYPTATDTTTNAPDAE